MPYWFLAQEAAADPAAASSRSWFDSLTDPDKVGAMATELAKNLLLAAIIFVVGRWIARGLVGVLRKMLRRSQVEETLVGFFGNIAYALLLIFVVLASLERLGVNTTSVSAIIAAAGLAVGFALQGSLSNFASGVMLVLFKPIRVGDVVTAGGTTGKVEEIALFATVFRAPDGRKVIVPNSAITGGTIENLTANGMRRVDMKFGIGYGDDIDRARQVLQSIVTSDERVLKEPAPLVAVSAHGESSVELVCRPWVKPEHYWDVWCAVHERAKKEFDLAGISIPFPQRDVHLFQAA